MSESMHCRSCFESIDPIKQKCFKLIDKLKNYEVTIAQFLSDCTGLCLNNNSAKKQIICTSCKYKLISFYKFRQKFFDTDRRFKELKLENVNVQVEVKLKDMKIEVDIWQPEYRNENYNHDYEEKENKLENDEELLKTIEKPSNSKKGRPRTRIRKTVRKVQIHEYRRKRRNHDPERKENLAKFKRNHEGLYECPRENCPGLFKNMGHMEVHFENKHPDTDQTTFPCDTCGEEFLTFLLHKRHILKFHTPRPYICDICGNK